MKIELSTKEISNLINWETLATHFGEIKIDEDGCKVNKREEVINKIEIPQIYYREIPLQFYNKDK